MQEFFLKISLKKDNVGQMILGFLFILYLVMGFKTPDTIADKIDTMGGKMVLFILAIYMFLNFHPVLAVLGLLVIFDLMRSSASATGLDALKKYEPTEEKKMSQFSAFNQFPYTLEQEIVKKMAPQVNSGSVLSQSSFKPKLNDLHGATPLNSSN
jgi:hypothetical protein